MDRITGRANHIEDYLVQLHSGQWFGWSDSKNKIYANLIIHDDSKTKPTEQECIDGLETMQSEYDNNDWKRNRISEYPSWQDQMDMQYWDKVNNTSTWQTAIAKVKSDNPKENS